jgi:hypothetical protein
LRGRTGHFVLGAQREQGGNQHLEGRAPPVGDEGDNGRIPPAVIGLDEGDEAVYVKGAHWGHGKRFFPDTAHTWRKAILNFEF